ncbi:M13 family metallopeptidase [Danxiaibacter flavus]|uniref:M13 family metallopeptidase n=1 Tax=Danxiaibacter flavus TaxID=3049108 RepID=A0ABV3ZC68_9BACT|nr:M13 family metallopeptidase [Chitinophagaceae bacterium DXS]
MKKKILLATALVAIFAACKQADNKKEGLQGDILITNMDTTVNPAQDFFDFANGGWLKKNPIPGDETGWGIGQLVNKELYERKLKINQDAASKKDAKGVEQQIGDFWKAGMDTVSIEKMGLDPLKSGLAKINAVSNIAGLMSVAAELHKMGVGVFFDEGISQDAMNSDVMSFQLWQGGLGLPNRDYYFKTDERTTKIRNAYPGYISKVFQLAGNDTATAAKKATAIVALETQLAKASRKLEDLRDPYKNYNKMSVAGLQKTAPGVDWNRTFLEIGLPKLDTVIIGQPEFYKALNEVVTKESLQTLKDYMSFHLVNDFAPYLSKAFVDAKFDFYNKTIRGAQEQRPRWKRVLDAEEGAMGEALGQLFAKEYFNEKAKARYEEMVERVRLAYKARIEKLDWMGDSTKQKALTKLAGIKKKVGYPDKWKDFSAMKITPTSYVQNIIASREWWNQYNINKLGKPVDRDEWDMTPQTYNAYYNPSNNEIVLPAGQFTVPGYRDEQLDDALVYGYAAASTIGHEITHGFDDEGRQFDEKGNLHSWWTKEDETKFTQRAQLLVNQFNNIVALDTMHLNGKASLGENLADLGGILIGLDAFKQTDAYKKGEKINGHTPLQRFFLGYSLGWLYQNRKEQLASQILTDVHAPAKFRVNGPFPNVPEFYEAFNVKQGDKMYLADSLRVKLW